MRTSPDGMFLITPLQRDTSPRATLDRGAVAQHFKGGAQAMPAAGKGRGAGRSGSIQQGVQVPRFSIHVGFQSGGLDHDLDLRHPCGGEGGLPAPK